MLVPQPSNDPHDPLNWSAVWKAATIAMAALYTLIQPFTQVAIGPIFPIFVKEWNITSSQCANFAGTTVLTLGYINFVWVPLAETFGRRLVFLSSLIIILGANIWHALATSYRSFLGSCVLEGLGGGPVETLFPMIISDVIFLNDRGKYVTLHLTTLFSSLMLSPVVSAAMAQNVGWRNFYWLNVGLRGALILAAIFVMPETKWRRGQQSKSGSMLNILPTKIARRAQALQPAGARGTDEDVGRYSDTSMQKNFQHDSGLSQELPSGGKMTDLTPDYTDDHIGRGSPCRAQFQFWAKSDAQENLLLNLAGDFFITFKIFFFPIVAFGGFSFSWSASLYGYINFGQSQLFSQPP